MKRRIVIAPTLNEYEVEDEFFITYEAGMPVYIFVAVEDQYHDGRWVPVRTQLNVPVAAVVEMHVDYNHDFIAMMRESSERVLEAQMKRQAETPPATPDTPTEGVEDHERRDYI